jgi:hypothetical protein
MLLASCGHSTVPAPTPESRTVTGRLAYVDSATFDSIQRANPPDPQMLAVTRRFDSLAALVDTIVVLSADSIVLHVGEVVERSLVRTQARRASGEELPTYPGFREIEDRSIATFTEVGIAGLKPGRTRLVLTVMSKYAHAPPSYVPLVVLP